MGLRALLNTVVGLYRCSIVSEFGHVNVIKKVASQGIKRLLSLDFVQITRSWAIGGGGGGTGYVGVLEVIQS